MPKDASLRSAAIVTGGLRGIGRACALGLAQAGFNVLLNDRDVPENLNLYTAIKCEFDAIGADCAYFPCDVGDLTRHSAMIETVLQQWGRLDCLVNNAGIAPRQRGDLLEVSPESFDDSIRVNTRAVFFLTQAAAKRMLHQPPQECHRSIINITSSNAEAVSILRGEYCISKIGASMATKLFGVRLANAGIGVYEVRPGIIATDMTRPVKGKYDALIRDHLVPAERWGTPEDVASTVVSMAKGQLRYTVGQVVTVDGGLIMPRF
ncbi:MAG TPA: 3-ketoacyl-ACP reductase [Acidisarcina sp.]|nr:3-ketoacyl-ACP reductase [Acidisarcina sp.]